ncbi:MAG: class I SAM-dependent methyltransferase [Bacteroides sp.]|nr:class I SAM-dependent methyltransferase [Bacteroides sp.]
MENCEKIELYVQLWDLCQTIQEGTAYIINSDNVGESGGVTQDIFSAIDTLTDCLLQENLLTNELYNILTDLRVALYAPLIDFNNLRQLSQNLLGTSRYIICNALITVLDKITNVTKPTAEKLFHFLDGGLQSSHVVQLALDTCAKCAFSAPMESFELTLKIFEQYPNLLAKKEYPHPDYVYRPSRQRIFEKCPICGGEGKAFYRAFSYFMNDFSYPNLPVKLWMKCRNCKNLYTLKFSEDILTPSVLNDNVAPNANRLYAAASEVNTYHLYLWSNILNKLNSYVNCQRKNILEVGIGKGELLSVALEMGYQVDAVEIMKNQAQSISDILGISIWNGDFLNYHTAKTYSIIIMGDVIEHIIDPTEALRNAHRLLDDNGILWLSTPNYESAFTKMAKFKDPMWLEPYHITYFSYSGLEALIKQCGFEVIEYSVSNRYNGSMELIIKKA